ncbi:PAS domain S-box protein [Desulfatibacillum aliphaticivorans]|uniref:PAS domain S-box protein n=1 Tax=Desulfatibacillum aliphaticivorans TaxID=218208 RepID=UPI0004143EDC|nr:PAS domain S-box protein [Desulfatibacillum aliphaticivorans]
MEATADASQGEALSPDQESLVERLESCETRLHMESMRRQAVQEAWEISEARYQSLIEGMEDIVFTLDSRGEIIQVNPAVKSALGYSPDELIGRRLREFILEPDQERALNQLSRVFVHSPQTGEYRVLDKNGSPVWFRVTGSPVHVMTGAGGVRCLASEITRERMQQQELVWSRQMASAGQQAVFLAREFAQAWRETQDHISSLDNMAKEEPELGPFWAKFTEAAARLKDAAKMIASLDPAVNEMLRAVNLNQSIVNVFRLFRSRFERKGIRTALSLSTQIPFTMAWSRRMEHALFILLNHACAAVEIRTGSPDAPGEISVTSRRKKDRIIIELSDNGPGLSREDCQRIFDFNYLRPGGGAEDVGGLHMSWSIIADHGGSLKAGASPEGGALFTIELPVRRPGA